MLRVNDGDSRVSDEKEERFSGDYFVKKKTGVFPADKLFCLLVCRWLHFAVCCFFLQWLHARGIYLGAIELGRW